MTDYPAPALSAQSLLDLASRKVAPFDEPYWVASIDGTEINPPMLVEGVNGLPEDLEIGTGIMLSVWPKRRRQHVMHGLIVDPQALLTFTFHDPA